MARTKTPKKVTNKEKPSVQGIAAPSAPWSSSGNTPVVQAEVVGPVEVFAGKYFKKNPTLMEIKMNRFKTQYIKNYKALCQFHASALQYAKAMYVSGTTAHEIDELFTRLRRESLSKYRHDMKEYRAAIARGK